MADYQWGDVVTHTLPFVKSIPTSAIQVAACDEINSLMWRRTFWRWSTQALTPIVLVNGQQDYALAAANATAYFRLWRARITQTNLTPDIARELIVFKWLPPALDSTGGIGSISLICYESTISKLRLNVAADVASPTVMQIDGEFQIKPVKVTATATNCVFPEQYFNVAASGLLWKFYKLGDDPRAGSEVSREGRSVYTGQLGEFMSALTEMAEAESQGEVQTSRIPEYSFGAGGAGNSGLFGAY